MTCIVGLVQDGKVIMGGDSAASSGNSVRTTAVEKVFRRGPFLIGYTSSFRMGQILQHLVDLPEADIYDYAYMVTKFVEVVRLKFKDCGYAKIDNGEESGGTFLIGVGGLLFEINSDYQVQLYTDGMAAIGCGSDFALGALKAGEHLAPKDRVLNALSISAYFCGWVKPPFIILD